jgi:hypothetical protein
MAVGLGGESGHGQKVKSGYDKAADFAQYKTYTWAKPDHPPTRPLLYQRVVNDVDYELEHKGLKRVESGGDLMLVPYGGFDQTSAVVPDTPTVSTLNSAIDMSMWAGPLTPGGAGVSPIVSEGTLVISLADQARGRIVWQGSVTQKLDIEHKKESIERVDKAIEKLFKEYPPQQK